MTLQNNGSAPPWTIPALRSATVDVIFDPQTTGARAVVLKIESDDAAKPVLNVNITGQAFIAPELELIPTSIDFGKTHTMVNNAPTATVLRRRRRNGGGGGGAGGCGGGGCASGSGESGSFGGFLVNSTGAEIFLSTITAGDGGRGGGGGAGGSRGAFGTGGVGCLGDIGQGGDGGSGGNGGGAGGASHAIYISGSLINATGNVLTAGNGGAGGASLGSPGANGAAAAVYP